MIVVTGATGKLGRHVIDELLKTVPAEQVVAGVRSTEKAADLAARGVTVRVVDYSKPETLALAFAGAEKVLLISSNEVGARVAQHKAVIDAAVVAQVKLFAYTSLLRADTSALALAAEHVATEAAIRDSGLPAVILRNGWYLENHTEALGPAVEHGVILGAAQDGLFAAAARLDYAAAAAAVLIGAGHEGKSYELAGDSSYSLPELAAEVSKASGKAVRYQNLSEEEYKNALIGFGLPAEIAGILSDSDAGAAKGELDSKASDLRGLIGRPSTSLAEAVRAAVRAR
ncbi:SDR family oxidoreductase [Granulicella sibirica]|uniref:NADPH:quinone oxidoreductase 2 n=1 Tax=Granulicella sibirica TaxID=2479048 RepID=A0A4Q0SXN5_9BACT|nr:SDR family oxidoreductase [Granulicella sibirica]RXH55913.1 NADPH:quinone oxidoreductase 2 [Granulicella sibirica]